MERNYHVLFPRKYFALSFFSKISVVFISVFRSVARAAFLDCKFSAYLHFYFLHVKCVETSMTTIL